MFFIMKIYIELLTSFISCNHDKVLSLLCFATTKVDTFSICRGEARKAFHGQKGSKEKRKKTGPDKIELFITVELQHMAELLTFTLLLCYKMQRED